jgi:hypothetical protein
VNLSLKVAKVGISKSVTWCEKWKPNWSSTADWYTLDWDGAVSAGQWREVTYLLALRKHRCQCFKVKFTSSANYAV